MPRRPDFEKTLTRRALIVGGAMGLGGAALLARLFTLQFLRGETYKTLAEGNRVKLQLLTPPRGRIVDCNGVELAGSRVNYRLFLEREHPEQAKRTLETLARLMGWDEARSKALFAQLSPRPRGPLLISDHVDWEMLARLEYHLTDLPAMLLEEGALRTYPFGEHASHLIGYVGRVAEGEARADDPLARLTDFKIGKNGVEQRYDAALQGIAGTRQLEVNATGVPVRELQRKAPVEGARLPLTIDSRLQERIVARLAQERSAAVAVMEVHSGDVKALVSMPGFDPNLFSKGIPAAYWKTLIEDERHPLLNKAISGLYPPGSIFKMVTGLAALQAGKATAATRVHCPGYFMLGNHRFGCWKPGGHGSMDMVSALQHSCDTYFYTIARAAGIEALAAMGKTLGIGEVTGIGLKGEKAGIMPSPAWKKSAGRGVWNPGETINTSIGQGDVLVTPLQMALMTARLASGKRVLPRLSADDPASAEPLGVDAEHLALVLRGMDAAVNLPGGTAYGSRIPEEAGRMAGKTGTAQVRHLAILGQDQNRLPWHLRHHGWFVAYAPVDNPLYACCVLVEHGGGGSSAAAPVARDVMAYALGLSGIIPLPEGGL